MRTRDYKKKKVTFRSHSLRIQTKERVSLRRRSEKVLCHCSLTHYEAQNRRNLTRQNNEPARERGWKEEGKQEIMKTSLISADASPHLSCHCWNQYKLHRWDALKNAWLRKMFRSLSRRHNLYNCTHTAEQESKNLYTTARRPWVKFTGGTYIRFPISSVE